MTGCDRSGMLRLRPGSPLRIAHGGPADGLQIALKGGQVGGDDYFSMIRAGEV